MGSPSPPSNVRLVVGDGSSTTGRGELSEEHRGPQFLPGTRSLEGALSLSHPVPPPWFSPSGRTRGRVPRLPGLLRRLAPRAEALPAPAEPLRPPRATPGLHGRHGGASSGRLLPVPGSRGRHRIRSRHRRSAARVRPRRRAVGARPGAGPHPPPPRGPGSSRSRAEGRAKTDGCRRSASSSTGPQPPRPANLSSPESLPRSQCPCRSSIRFLSTKGECHEAKNHLLRAGVLLASLVLAASGASAAPTEVTLAPPNGARFLSGQRFDLRVEGKGTGPFSATLTLDGVPLSFTSGQQNTTTHRRDHERRATGASTSAASRSPPRAATC